MRMRLVLAVLCLAALPRQPLAATELTPILDLRLRAESWRAPTASHDRDDYYEFLNLRLRGGVDAEWERFSLHLLGQAAGSFGLPEAGSFGPGPAIVNANRGDTDPTQLSIVELSAAFHGPDHRVELGRVKWYDGLETTTGVPQLDDVKSRRIAERLVGNWDWVNVGRRYDGLTFKAGAGSTHFAGFGLRPVAGGIEYDDAHEELEDYDIYGATITGRYGRWIPKSELRFFVIDADDERPGTLAAIGGGVDVTSYGLTYLVGGQRGDAFLWLTAQDGDWGAASHDAWAMILEGGGRFLDGPAEMSLRAGIALASGDDDPSDGDHETFFNVLPTNHKFYGMMDFNAFSNLHDLYLELIVDVGLWQGRCDLHYFEIAEADDGWYGGSGAFDDDNFGYIARRPSFGGRFGGATIGTEMDFVIVREFRNGLFLDAGVGYFAGGEVAQQALPVDDDGTFAYLQLQWSLP